MLPQDKVTVSHPSDKEVKSQPDLLIEWWPRRLVTTIRPAAGPVRPHPAG